MLCGVAVGACSSQRVLTDLDDARELREEADELERRGEVEAAAELYLTCLDRCPSVARINGTDLKRLAGRSPDVERSVWDKVAIIEARLVAATTPDEALRDDLLAVVSVYRAWGVATRASELLHRLRSARAPSAVYETVLAGCAVGMGDELAISAPDAEALANQLSLELAQDQTMTANGATAAEAEQLEKVRHRTFVAYAAAMLASGHMEPAKRAASQQIGKDSRNCGTLLDAATRTGATAVVALLCKTCVGESRCGPPP